MVVDEAGEVVLSVGVVVESLGSMEGDKSNQGKFYVFE